MTKIQAWFYAFRLRTLPLAFSSILAGSFIAFSFNPAGFSWVVFVLCLLTTLFLQVLSNLANDYGDSQKGTDNENRIGPPRAIQAGLLTVNEMVIGIVLFTVLCLASGLSLLFYANSGLLTYTSVLFFFLGLASITAAIKYTVGKGAYGYYGYGDLFVFLFFGLLGVGGSFYLQSHALNLSVLFPAISIGCLSAGVLNLNNMRDAESDALSNKNTLVVKIGVANAKNYHKALVVIAFISAILFVVLNFQSTMQLLFIVTVPLFRRHLRAVKAIENSREFDPLLKDLAIATFIFSLLFSAGQVIGAFT